MRNFLNAVKSPDIVKSINAGRETSMEAENLVVDEGGQREVIEQVGEVLPHVCIAVFAQALVVEAIYLCDLTRFVVTTKDCNSAWVSDLQRNEERDSFH